VKASGKKRIIYVLMGLVLILTIAYLLIGVYYEYYFMNKTTINGIDCSNKSPKEVEKLLENEIRYYYLQIEGRNNLIERISSDQMDMKIVIKEDIKKLLKAENPYKWILYKGKDIKIDMEITYNLDKLNNAINKLSCMDPEKMVDAKGVSIEYKNNEINLDEGLLSTKADTEVLRNEIVKAIDKMSKKLVISNTKAYLIAETSKNDLSKLKEELNSYISTKITLLFGEEEVIIDEEDIKEWISLDKDSKVIFDEEKIKEFINEFSKKYETMGQTREFKNSYGESIKVGGGDYGYWVDVKAEKDNIIKDILNAKDVKRSANFLQKGAEFGSLNDFSNTYIEISLSKKHLFAYLKGELVTDCDIISNTPKGVYNLRFMMKNYKFNRPGFNKSVPLWMVYYGASANENIGIVSCNWRTDFGKTDQVDAALTGSVLIPDQNAQLIYEKLSDSIPVIIY